MMGPPLAEVTAVPVTSWREIPGPSRIFVRSICTPVSANGRLAVPSSQNSGARFRKQLSKAACGYPPSPLRTVSEELTMRAKGCRRPTGSDGLPTLALHPGMDRGSLPPEITSEPDSGRPLTSMAPRVDRPHGKSEQVG
jgi:hypothetical protein